MHIIISIFVAIGAILFWLSRASRNMGDIAEAAQELSNLPRKMRYRKQAGKRGLDLVQDPVEAATVLMISVARMDGLSRVTDSQVSAIADQLKTHMQIDEDEATDIITQMRSLTQYLKQSDSTLFPMVDFLRGKIDRQDALDLSAMLQDIAVTENPINSDQKNFIRSFEERLGIGS